MVTKSFKGLIADGGQDRINLHHNNGKTGYRIVKFELLGIDGNTAYENTIQVWSVQQTTVGSNIDFSNGELIAAAVFQQSVSNQSSAYQKIIVDNMIFNQDIYITYKGVSSGVGYAINYYLELEEMPLALDEATVATLKDIRNSGDPT